MARNLFVIRTPLQLFNATEARDRFHPDDENHLLLYFRKAVDLAQMETLLDDRWQQITRFPFTGVRQQFYPLWLNRIARQLGTVHRLYTGLLSNIPLHLANTLQPEEFWLLDDGNETLLQARQVEQWRTEPGSRPVVSLKQRLLGRKLDRTICDRLNYFSLYQPPGVSEQRLVQNDYRSFRSKVARLPKREAICFIGSNLVPQYLAESDFLALMREVVAFYAPQPVSYCAHRYESDALLAAVADCGLQVVKYPTILEYAFVQQGYVPATVATFRSTALDTLHRLYGVKQQIFSFDLSLLAQPEQQQEYRDLLRNYAQNNIPVHTFSSQEP